MALADKILREAMITELKTTSKEPLDSGTDHNVYPSRLRGDVVIKAIKSTDSRYQSDFSLRKYEQAAGKFPEYVARVVRSAGRYLVVERLDTERFKAEDREMKDYAGRMLGKEYGPKDSMFAFIDSLYLDGKCQAFEDMTMDEVAAVFARSERHGGIFESWMRLIEGVYENDISNDLIPDNVGYDKNGLLKMLDV